MKLQILIADSGEHAARNLNSLLSVLEDTDYTVSRHTTSLNEAVSLVLSRQFDILLCINRAPEYIASKLEGVNVNLQSAEDTRVALTNLITILKNL